MSSVIACQFGDALIGDNPSFNPANSAGFLHYGFRKYSENRSDDRNQSRIFQLNIRLEGPDELDDVRDLGAGERRTKCGQKIFIAWSRLLVGSDASQGHGTFIV